jgi:DNA polymerase I-like protein with 3'-5' exonuclease and polymerase domains
VQRYSIKSIQERRAVAEAVVVPMLRGVRDRKVESTYNRLEPGKDARIRTVISPDTASFRMSSGESGLWPQSTNLQNIEKKVAKLDPLYRVRDIFVPDPGLELVAVDLSGAEAVLCGAYSDDWQYVDKLLAGADTHSELATFMFGVAECTALQRDIAKTIRYASQYAAKVPTITINLNREADTTGMYFTQDEVAVMHKKLLQLHPLELWWANTKQELDKNKGVLYNCFGYKRTFHDPDPDERLKQGLSFYPQSTVAWIMNLALPQVHTIAPSIPRVDLLLQIHDELLFQAELTSIPLLVQTVTPLLTRPFKIHGRELYIPVEWKRGSSWGSMKSFNHKEL